MAGHRRLQALAAALDPRNTPLTPPPPPPAAPVAAAASPPQAVPPPALPLALVDTTMREQLTSQGFCVVPNVLSPELLANLLAVTNAFLDAQLVADALRHRSQGYKTFVPFSTVDCRID